jgi:hypothetical protein
MSWLARNAFFSRKATTVNHSTRRKRVLDTKKARAMGTTNELPYLNRVTRVTKTHPYNSAVRLATSRRRLLL